jgi:hypothetical protein
MRRPRPPRGCRAIGGGNSLLKQSTHNDVIIVETVVHSLLMHVFSWLPFIRTGLLQNYVKVVRSNVLCFPPDPLLTAVRS